MLTKQLLLEALSLCRFEQTRLVRASKLSTEDKSAMLSIAQLKWERGAGWLFIERAISRNRITTAVALANLRIKGNVVGYNQLVQKANLDVEDQLLFEGGETWGLPLRHNQDYI